MAAAVRATASGEAIGRVARRCGVSDATLYNWKKTLRRYGRRRHPAPPSTRRGTRKLKQFGADLSLDKVHANG
jgi:transposase-like protein